MDIVRASSNLAGCNVLQVEKTGSKNAPRVRLELTTYRLTAGRAADCAIQELMQQQPRTKKFDNLDFVQNSPWRDSNPQSLPPEGSALSIRPQGRQRLPSTYCGPHTDSKKGKFGQNCTACGDRTRDQSIKSRTLYLTELRRQLLLWACQQVIQLHVSSA